MRTLAVLPVKTFSEAKGRLADELWGAWRRGLADAMYADVLTALRRSERLDATLVVTGDLTAQQVAGGHGAIVLDDRSEAGHNPAARDGIARALELGFERVLLVPGDCPTLSPAELDMLLADPPPQAPDAVVVPDRHGEGTNALLLTPPDALGPAFGPGSRERHLERARHAGVAARVVEVPSLALDVDTPADLAALVDELDRRRGGAAHTRGLLNRLARSRAPAPG